MSTIDDFNHIIVGEFWSNIVGLKSDLGKTKQTIGSGKFIDRISQKSIRILGNFAKEWLECFRWRGLEICEYKVCILTV